ncbi:MAG: hypothetical protein MJZ96_07595 [Paludibacteraceae bacterium]|nr:hypothetical protein [Paludibacteraceae bacterium]
MISAHEEAFLKFEEKLNQLLQEYNKLKDRNEELEKQLSEREAQLQDAQLEILGWRRQYETLKLAKAFGQSEEDKKRAYRRISKLVNDIDTCIQLIKE